MENNVVKTQLQKQYTYKAVKNEQSTRLLKVERDMNQNSSFNNGAVNYHIIEFDFDNLPEYETVSYAWGNPTKDFFILVEGNKILPITESLAVGLPRLVEYCRTGYLWIDQICTIANFEAQRD
jgi:hypothetical protein